MNEMLPDVLRSRAPNNSKHDQLRAADEIEKLTDRAESAEAVLRVTLSMLKDESHTREDIEGYLESSAAITNSTSEGHGDD